MICYETLSSLACVIPWLSGWPQSAVRREMCSNIILHTDIIENVMWTITMIFMYLCDTQLTMSVIRRFDPCSQRSLTTSKLFPWAIAFISGVLPFCRHQAWYTNQCQAPYKCRKIAWTIRRSALEGIFTCSDYPPTFWNQHGQLHSSQTHTLYNERGDLMIENACDVLASEDINVILQAATVQQDWLYHTSHWVYSTWSTESTVLAAPGEASAFDTAGKLPVVAEWFICTKWKKSVIENTLICLSLMTSLLWAWHLRKITQNHQITLLISIFFFLPFLSFCSYLFATESPWTSQTGTLAEVNEIS